MQPGDDSLDRRGLRLRGGDRRRRVGVPLPAARRRRRSAGVRDRAVADARSRPAGGRARLRACLARAAVRRLPHAPWHAARERGRRRDAGVPRGAPCVRRIRAADRTARLGRRLPQTSAPSSNGSCSRSSSAACTHRRSGSSTRWRRWWGSALRCSTPTSAPHISSSRDDRLAGVIDWGDARLGDPALDYAWALNGPFADWEVDPDLRRRAWFYHRLDPWYEAHYGLFTDQPAHTERGLAGIRARL